jgi:hypothetical protein
MAYLASPIDLVPGIIPVAGQLDDLAAVLYAIRTALRGLPADQGRRHLVDVGLAPTALAADIAIVREATGWTVRTVATAGKSVVSLWMRAARAAVRMGGGLRASLSLRRKPRRDVDRG